MARVEFHYADGVLLAKLWGEIDHHSAQQLREQIDIRLSQSMVRTLCMDMSGVDFMDSSGIGLILGRAKRMKGLRGRMIVQEAPGQICKVLDLAGIEYMNREG